MKFEIQMLKGENAGVIAALLEAAIPGMKLHADAETDTVNGSVTVGGKTCFIELYDADCVPGCSLSHGGHKSILKSLLVKPSIDSIKSILKTVNLVI